MTTFRGSLAKETWALWEVLWYPEDYPPSEVGARSYVVAPDMNAASLAISQNPADIRSVTRVHNGGVIIAEVKTVAG